MIIRFFCFQETQMVRFNASTKVNKSDNKTVLAFVLT